MSAADQMAEIRAVLAAFDWERDDRQYALERIEEIAGRHPELARRIDGSVGQTSVLLDGSAMVAATDLATVLDALDVAADYKRDRAGNCPDCDASPADLCSTCDHRLNLADEYDALARRLEEQP